MPKPPPLLWKKLAWVFGGDCKLWIDQSDKFSDPIDDLPSAGLFGRDGLTQQLSEILFSRGQPSASEGVCIAVVYDWIRNSMAIGEDFIAGFRGADSVYYRALQLQHRITIFDQKATYDYLKLWRRLLRVAEGVDAISSSLSTRQQIVDLRQRIESTQARFRRLQKAIYQPSFGVDIVHVQGVTEKFTYVSADEIVSKLATPDLQGWILLVIEGGVLKPEGGHAIGFLFLDSSYWMLDPNTGLFEFRERADLLTFFAEVLFEQIYTFVYGMGRFRLVRYSLYPSLDDYD